MHKINRLIPNTTKLSHIETKLLEDAAREANISKSAYLRSLVLDKLLPLLPAVSVTNNPAM